MNQSHGVKWGLFRLLLVVLLLLIKSSSVQGQVNASITGRVVDTSGAAIPQVSVTVQSLETGETRSVAADETGNYRVLQLPVGHYSVKGEKQGFKVRVQ